MVLLPVDLGDRLHVHLTGSRLVLERQQDAVAELGALAGDVPKSRSLVDEPVDAGLGGSRLRRLLGAAGASSRRSTRDRPSRLAAHFR